METIIRSIISITNINNLLEISKIQETMEKRRNIYPKLIIIRNKDPLALRETKNLQLNKRKRFSIIRKGIILRRNLTRLKKRIPIKNMRAKGKGKTMIRISM